MTLEQMGLALAQASRKLTPAQRKDFGFDALVAALKTPVGMLREGK